MRTKFVHYELMDGYLDHWLVAGPQTFRLEQENSINSENIEQIAVQYDDPELGITEMPVERGPLTAGTFNIGDFSAAWEYYSCKEDHRVDQSSYVPACAYLRSWAYNQINSKEEEETTLEIISPGPIRIWLNGENIGSRSSFPGSEPSLFTIPIVLQKGMNPLFIRFENFGFGYSSHYFSARIVQRDSLEKPVKLEACIPTLIKTIGRRNQLEKVFHTLYMDRDAYSREQKIFLNWPPADKASKKDERAYSTIRLQSPSGRIYAEAEVDGTPGDQLALGIAAQYPEGLYDVLMMPKTWEYYDQDLRITHKISFWNTGRRQYAETPVGSFDSRQHEALDYAANLEPGSVERETARMALARWQNVDDKSIHAAVDRVLKSHESSVLDLLSLLGMLYQFGDQAQFSEERKAAVKTAALGYPFGIGKNEPEATVCGAAGGNDGECRQLSKATCQILAGQAYPDQVFSGSELPGREICQLAEQQVLDWMRQRAAWGFADWGSESGYQEILASLAYLLDYAESESVGEMAAALLDKLLFTLALNSFKGLYGGTSRQRNATSVKGGTSAALNAIAYLMWGQGILTPHLLALVPLACSKNYRLPSIFASVASSPPDALWSKERHTPGENEEGINQAAYKTPEYLLASAQSYRPGAQGRAEHLWQATLGPGAVVFTNHPGSSGEGEAHLPGYWRGNGTLPRIAQWKDALLSIYRLPETAPLGLTHAYFPTFAFDEYHLKNGWAFARKGDAYLALTSAIPFELREHGPNAYRELFAAGRENAWFCQLGSAARDGNFASFQEKVRTLQFDYHDTTARCTTLAGDALVLPWQGSLMVNQTEEKLHGFHHYENAYTTVEFPARSMEILVGTDGLRLNLE